MFAFCLTCQSDSNYCSHVLKQLGAAEEGGEVLSPQVELHGTDKALPKAVSVAELVKRSSKRRLRQTTTLSDDKGKAKISIVLAVENK